MDFTYTEYTWLINLLKQKKYEFIGYPEYKNLNCNIKLENKERVVIFRHDIDNSLERALKIAKLENDNGVKSTYFVLLSTDFYNVFSKKSNEILTEILSLGHEIGLHFDEKRYDINNEEDLEKYILYEKRILEEALNTELLTVSMHRPSKWILENNIEFESMINSYSNRYLNEFKYLSDSRMHWREDVIGIVNSEKYQQLHILTHPFWYSDDQNDIKEKVSTFLKDASKERYFQMKDNIRDLEDIILDGEF